MRAAPTSPDLRHEPPSKKRSSLDEYFAVIHELNYHRNIPLKQEEIHTGTSRLVLRVRDGWHSTDACNAGCGMQTGLLVFSMDELSLAIYHSTTFAIDKASFVPSSLPKYRAKKLRSK
jgi:hypothetical protein